jgi:oligopeptide/dipeptide ABC transporter ATP-binding protein
MSAAAPLIEARKLTVLLGGGRRFLRPPTAPVRAVADVSLAVFAGETLGLVGESGCGKTTLGRTLLGIQRETSGEVRLEGALVSGVAPARARAMRRAVQYVHQDAGAALDPWWSIGRILAEGLVIQGERDAAARDRKIDAMLSAVGLDPSFRPRYVHELSGGQLRRVTLARILVLEPRVIILDEPTSGLDLSVQATVLNLLAELKARLALTYLFISHDLSVVARMCDRVAIMYLGRIVELGPAASVFAAPAHPYTRALLAAAPSLEPGTQLDAPMIEGEPPSPRNLPSGCAFRTRCPYAAPQCAATVPPLSPFADREVACLRVEEVAGEQTNTHVPAKLAP